MKGKLLALVALALLIALLPSVFHKRSGMTPHHEHTLTTTSTRNDSKAQSSTTNAASALHTEPAKQVFLHQATGTLKTSQPIDELTQARIARLGVKGSSAQPSAQNEGVSTPISGALANLTPNELGQFPRVYIDPNETVAVDLVFPDGDPGESVSVRVEDGGNLDDNKKGKTYKLTPAKTIHFELKANADLGIYQVVTTHRSVVRVLDFWVGPELPIRE